MDTLSNELSLLASLLSAPDLDTKEALLELAIHYPWLQPAAEELARLPVDIWQAEHSRLFTKCVATEPFSPEELEQLHAQLPSDLPLKPLKYLYSRMGMGFLDASADYMGTLLECTAYLNANPKLGKIFWSELWHEHLAYWIPGFCNKLRNESRLALYRIVAERLYTLFPQVQNLATAVA